MRPRAPTIALLLLAAACSGDGENAVPGDVIDRETFIATYVDLRDAAVLSPEFQISSDQRAEILARHGVDGESLLRFADAHGRDLEFMNEVWVEVETRLQALGGERPPR
jgi:hypothetical protein